MRGQDARDRSCEVADLRGRLRAAVVADLSARDRSCEVADLRDRLRAAVEGHRCARDAGACLRAVADSDPMHVAAGSGRTDVADDHRRHDAAVADSDRAERVTPTRRPAAPDAAGVRRVARRDLVLRCPCLASMQGAVRVPGDRIQVRVPVRALIECAVHPW